jgi:hypothetical protein
MAQIKAGVRGVIGQANGDRPWYLDIGDSFTGQR